MPDHHPDTTATAASLTERVHSAGKRTLQPGARTPINFYFDFISPFGYFASLRIEELGRRHGREVEWTSMLLGVSVLKVMGIPPVAISDDHFMNYTRHAYQDSQPRIQR
jgi:2-hydroxychromene-2-carboxylate isomerase